MTDPLILIVEDETKLAGLMTDYLHQSGFRTHHIGRGDDVMPWLAEHTPDAMLLDLMLPGMDGLSICREVRKDSALPILMVTARVDEIDRLLGLELGADDYICKPFSPREMVARVKAVLRRSLANTHEAGEKLQLDNARLQLGWGNRRCEFTAVEFQLLRQLAAEPGRIFSRSQLMDGMYSDHRVVSERTIDSHIKKVRRKLEGVFGEHDAIQSVYGAGYRFELP